LPLPLRRNSVAVVSDGSAILGLGDLGPEAAMPVMEGKIMLLKESADIDGWPLCLAARKTPMRLWQRSKRLLPRSARSISKTLARHAVLRLKKRLKEELDIPVMHDDQHGTAVVLLAGLINALKVVGKGNLQSIKVVGERPGSCRNRLLAACCCRRA
jgi:malate dehydrogenase (oxaloacetate-decarboxylating)